MREPVAGFPTDQRRAGLTGLEFLRQDQAVAPATPQLGHVGGFIPKPWNAADIDRPMCAAKREQPIIAKLPRHEP
ncbi:MAG: hypothetical protein ABI847_21465 [Anaerolineales bacterium]